MTESRKFVPCRANESRPKSLTTELPMWCKSCRQDVPGIASLDEGAFHCARCGARVGRRRSAVAEAALAHDICDQGIDLAGDVDFEPSATEALHQWAEDEHLENVRRLLRPFSTGEAPTGMKPAPQEKQIRFDPPASHSLRVPLPEAALHALAAVGRNPEPPQFQLPAQRVVATNVAPPPQRSAVEILLGGLAWCVISLGLMGLVCGGVLTGWSLATSRAELWKFGLPTLMGGLVILTFGLVLAFLAKRSVRKQATLVASQAKLPVGYAVPHFRTPSEGNASPAMLAELRGQLDRLTAQMEANNSSGKY
jgi:hypothetical protein